MAQIKGGPGGYGGAGKGKTPSGAKGISKGDNPGGPPKGNQGGNQNNQLSLDQWVKQMGQQAAQGGLLRGAIGQDGTSGLELVNLLQSNPELAGRVRTWMKENPRKKGFPGHLEDMAGSGRRPALLAAFPELLQQFVAATGKALVYDAEGNPVRLAKPGDGVREGDTLVEPDLIGADGEVLPAPEPTDFSEPVIGSDAATQMMAARARTGGAQNDFFSYDELLGEE